MIFIKQFLTNRELRILEKVLPRLSEKDINEIQELRNCYKKLILNKTSNNPSKKAWDEHEFKLTDNILKNDIRLFLRWEVVLNTMFVSQADYLEIELDYLKSSGNWAKRWSYAVRESIVGSPIPYSANSNMSGNSIHHSYHLAQFEAIIESPINDFDFIFEFGGGYGSMCRIVHELGFKGVYIIFDLPSFSHLQWYYLKSNNLLVASSAMDHEAIFDKQGIYCLSNLNMLMSLFKKYTSVQKSLFLSTWAFSETPLELRSDIEKLCARQNYFLFGYQDTFGEIDNIEYFRSFKNKFNSIRWIENKIAHIKNSYYLFGKAS